MWELDGKTNLRRWVVMLPAVAVLLTANLWAETKVPTKHLCTDTTVKGATQPRTSATKRIAPPSRRSTTSAPRRITTPALTVVGRTQTRSTVTTPTLVIIGKPQVARSIQTPLLIVVGRPPRSQINTPTLTIVGRTSASTQTIATPALTVVGRPAPKASKPTDTKRTGI
jgi:hypothetical protein